MAFDNSTLVFHRLRLNNSICMLNQNDSIVASSGLNSQVRVFAVLDEDMGVDPRSPVIHFQK